MSGLSNLAWIIIQPSFQGMKTIHIKDFFNASNIPLMLGKNNFCLNTMHNNVITNHAEAKVLMFIQIIYIHVNIYVHFYISTKCFIMYYHILSKPKIYFKHMGS